MTPKQEAFARSFVETGNASEAYRRAYDAKNMAENTVWKRASELLQNGVVAGRVKELQERAAKRTEITVQKLTEMTMKAYTEAQRIAPTTGQMQTASMIKASEFLGKLHGLVIERSEVTHKDSVEDLSEAELVNIARDGGKGIAAAAIGKTKPN